MSSFLPEKIHPFVVGFIASVSLASFAQPEKAPPTAGSRSPASVELREGMEPDDEVLSASEILEQNRTEAARRTVQRGEHSFSTRNSSLSQFSASARTDVGGLDDAKNACRYQVLKDLGWQVRMDGGRQSPTITAGNPCDNSDLDSALREGELVLHLPENGWRGVTPLQAKNVLADAINSDASICAYKFNVGKAARNAALALNGNEGYSFKFHLPLVKFHSDADEWQPGCIGNMVVGRDRSGRSILEQHPRCWRPYGSPSAAVALFSRSDVSSDCAIGLQAAEFEMLRQLHGRSFDQSFDRTEVVIGAVSRVETSKSITWGNWESSDTLVDVDATYAAKMGGRWFEGLSGYIGHVYGKNLAPGVENPYLESPDDRGENFMILSVSADAASTLRRDGGFQPLNSRNVEIWRSAQFAASDFPSLEQDDRREAQHWIGKKCAPERAPWRGSLRERVEKERERLDEKFGYLGTETREQVLRIIGSQKSLDDYEMSKGLRTKVQNERAQLKETFADLRDSVRVKVLAIIGSKRDLDDYEWKSSTPPPSGVVERAQEICRTLATDPVYAGVKVFVHGVPTTTFGGHIGRLIGKNPLTPYTVELYPSRIHSELYTRYVKMLASRCE